MIKKVFMMFVGVALMALPTMAQTFETQKIEQPNAVFQSTSALQGSGSQYSATPMLGADGTATLDEAVSTPAQAPSGPKRRRTISNPDDDVNNPIGDAVLPLLLMALAFCGVVYYRRKRC
jgi:hypothetical protein